MLLKESLEVGQQTDELAGTEGLFGVIANYLISSGWFEGNAVI